MSELDLTKGQDAAKLVRWFQQQKEGCRVRHTLEKIPYKTFYQENQRLFDGLCSVASKFKIDLYKYIKWFVAESGYGDFKSILSVNAISRFAEYLGLREGYKKIFDGYCRSAENLAQSCIEESYGSCLEYLKLLIRKNMLAEKFVTGFLSGHFIATIKNFARIYPMLDQMNQDTLRIIFDAREKLVCDTQDAFLMFKSVRVNPISFTDEIIAAKINENRQNRQNKENRHVPVVH